MGVLHDLTVVGLAALLRSPPCIVTLHHLKSLAAMLAADAVRMVQAPVKRVQAPASKINPWFRQTHQR